MGTVTENIQQIANDVNSIKTNLGLASNASLGEVVTQSQGVMPSEVYNNSLIIANNIMYGGSTKYKKLEYIESTGQEYIDTDIEATDIRFIDFKFMPTELVNSYQAYLSSYPDNFTIGAYQSLTKTFLRYQKKEIYKTNEISIENPTTIQINYEGIFYNNNKYFTDTSDAIGTKITPKNTLCIFTTSTHSTRAAMRFYNLKLYGLSGNIYANFIPVKYNKEPMLYDTVRNIYLSNSGDGQFIAGPEIEEEE